MSANDLIMLNAVLKQKRDETAQNFSEESYFEIFVAEQALKDFDLSYDEIINGITDGGGDGGIDSAYIFINGELILDDTEFSTLKKDIYIDVFFIQSKISKSFSEGQIDKFISTTNDVLDLSREIEELSSVYNSKLLGAIKRFRAAYKDLASKFPKLRFSYYYATKGDSVHPNVNRKVEQLRESIKKLFSSSDFDFKFLGSNALLELARQAPKTVYSIDLSENPISTMGVGGYVCLVGMKDYYNFITDSGKLIKNIFESNVRDYQGDIQVNEGIKLTLESKSKNDDFWWLNNGVTIIATRATLSGKRITIEDPQIVNGLQTSTEIYKYFSSKNTEGENRNILVRIIVPTELEIRDRIIKATNSQTKIPDASLRATEKIHRDIEEYLKPYSLFYDRRKNFYKNEGKPIDKIISITQLAQAVMSTLLGRPDNARARPSSLLKKEEDYKRVFNINYSLSLYLFCAILLKRTDVFVKSDAAKLYAEQRNNIRFHLMMFIAMKMAGKKELVYQDFDKLRIENINDGYILDCLGTVKSKFVELGGTDQLAKGVNFVEALKKAL